MQLMRLNAADKVVWRRYCAGLGVAHSEYSHHAKLAVEGNRIRVTSKGSEGSFVEILDLRNGWMRWRNTRMGVRDRCEGVETGRAFGADCRSCTAAAGIRQEVRIAAAMRPALVAVLRHNAACTVAGCMDLGVG